MATHVTALASKKSDKTPVTMPPGRKGGGVAGHQQGEGVWQEVTRRGVVVAHR